MKNNFLLTVKIVTTIRAIVRKHVKIDSKQNLKIILKMRTSSAGAEPCAGASSAMISDFSVCGPLLSAPVSAMLVTTLLLEKSLSVCLSYETGC